MTTLDQTIESHHLPWPQAEILAAARAMATGGGFAPTLLTTLADPHTDARTIIDSIQHAPGIALRVLKLANSAFYGRAGQVDNLDRAVQVLGFDAVRAVATAACLDRVLPASGGPTVPSSRELLRHSLATAVAAQSLAAAVAPEHRADAFLAGLLHDLGYVVVQRLSKGDASPEVLRFHADCAASVFVSWNLPATLVQSIQHHHQPHKSLPEFQILARILGAAERLAADAGHGLSVEPVAADHWPLPELAFESDGVVALRAELPAIISSLLIALGSGAPGGRR